MQIQIPQPTLRSLLSSVCRLRPGKAMPILSHVLLETDEGNTLYATTTDLSVRLEAQAPCRFALRGSICLPAQKLSEIVANLPATDVEITVSDAYRATIRAGGVEYKLAGVSDADFPAAPQPEGSRPVTLPAAALAGLLSATVKATSNDDTRHHIHGLYLEARAGTLRAVATDGHRLHVATAPAEAEFPGVILPKQVLPLLARDLEAAEGDVSLSLGRELEAEIAGVRYFVRLVDAQFPDYEQVIPKKETSYAEISREALASAARRVRLCATTKSHGIKAAFEPEGRVVLTSDDPDLGEAREEVECRLIGDPVTVGLNADYLTEALEACDGEEVRVGLTKAEEPVMVNAGGTTAVIMPIRL
jgi:DNA polymerase-3 subunit beta